VCERLIVGVPVLEDVFFRPDEFAPLPIQDAEVGGAFAVAVPLAKGC